MAEEPQVGISDVIRHIGGKKRLRDYEPEAFLKELGHADAVIWELAGWNKDKDKQRGPSKDAVKEKIKSTQLRKIFASLKSIEERLERQRKGSEEGSSTEGSESVGRDTDSGIQDIRLELLKLQPQLAYAAGRNVIPAQLYELLKTVLDPDKFKGADDFRRMFEFVEALLAYHKYRSQVGFPKTERRGNK